MAVLLWDLVGCNGPDASLLRPRPNRDAGPTEDAGGIDRELDGGMAGPPVIPIDPTQVDGPTESIDCMSDGEFTVCTRPHAETTCVGDDCLIVQCLGDWLDCDGEGDNGCETTLLTVDHCGRCGSRCALSNVVEHSCDEVEGAARCSIDHSCKEEGCMEQAPELGCKPDFGDCDGDPANGCETALETIDDCGSCGRSCEVDNTVVACEEARCVTVGCAPGFGTCGGDVCNSLASDAMNCGECDNECPAGADMCAGGRCTGLVCDDGTADCNETPGDLCEADLSGVEHCGTCGNTCPGADNASPVCTGSTCDIECNPGFADCNSDMDDGCEVDLDALANCGSCTTDCGGLPHVQSASCNGETCVDLTCEDGWDDCNGDPLDGCEQPLNTNPACGACGRSCTAAQGEASCATGSCEVTSCEPGWEDCNGELDDGCEADLGQEPNCGGCGIECGGGSTCTNGGCACETDAGCAIGSCCNGSCIDTGAECRFWPCIPGANRDFNNCGGCGIACIPFVHQGCCGFL